MKGTAGRGATGGADRGFASRIYDVDQFRPQGAFAEASVCIGWQHEI
jgi:hypothetical protein